MNVKFGILDYMPRKHMMLPLVLGLTLAVLLILLGYTFIQRTHDRIRATQSAIVKTHNHVAQLPQPKDIDLGVPSGSIMGQKERYQNAIERYKNLSFNAPSPFRINVVGWMTFSSTPKASIKPQDLAISYKNFVDNHAQLLATLEKTLVYNTQVDLGGLSTESEEFAQRAEKAGKGLQTTQTEIRTLDVPQETINTIDQELTSLMEANEALREEKDLKVWSAEVTSTQQTIRDTLQSYWSSRITALSQSKQHLVEYYTNHYQ